MSDYDSTQKRRNVVVGAFVVIACVALFWLVFMFGDLPTAVSELRSYEVYVQFPQAPGVDRNTPVRLAGYQIGRVVAVQPPTAMVDLRTGMRYLQTVVVMALDNRFSNIPSNVQVRLMKRGLGSSYIELVVDPTQETRPLDPNHPETAYLVNGIKLQGSTGTTSEFFPEESQRKLDQLITSLSLLINNANTILGDIQNQNNIKQALANLTEATKEATLTLKQVNELSKSGTATLAQADETMKKVGDSFIQTSMELNKSIAQTTKMLEEINKGQGSVGRLIYDESLYNNLVDSSRELQMMVEQAKLMIAQWRENGVKIKL